MKVSIIKFPLSPSNFSIPLNLTCITLARPPTHSTLVIASHSFRYASPHLWNQLPHLLRQPRLDLPLPDYSLLHDHLTSPVSSSPLLSKTPSFFHSKLKTSLSQILPSIVIWHLFRTDFTNIWTCLGLRFFLVSVFFYSFSYRRSFSVFLISDLSRNYLFRDFFPFYITLSFQFLSCHFHLKHFSFLVYVVDLTASFPVQIIYHVISYLMFWSRVV